MSSFSEHVKSKKQADQALLHHALNDVYRPLGEKFAGNAREGSQQEPLAAELSRICAYFSIPVPDSLEKMDPENMGEEVMMETGILRRKISLVGEWWKEGATPLLCTGADGSPHALIPGRHGGYQMFMDGKMIAVTEKTVERFEQTAYCFYRPLENKSISIPEFLRFLLSAFQSADLVCLLLISFFVGLIGLIMPKINQFIFNMVIPSGTSDELFGIGVLIGGTVLIAALFGLVRSIWISRIGNKLELLAQNAIWGRLMTLPADFFQKYDSGDLTQRVKAVDDICRILGGQLIPTILGALFSALYLVEIASITPKLFWPALGIVLLLQGILLITAAVEIGQTRKNKAVNSRLIGMVYQMLNGMAKIKIAGAENRAFARWAKVYGERELMPRRLLICSKALSSAVLFGGTMLLYYIASACKLTASDYIAFNSAFSLFYGAVIAISGVTTQIASLRPAFELLRPVLETTPENAGVKCRVQTLQGEIELNHVKFRYREDLPYVLNDLQLHIQPGEYLGIVGSSGCGKSTLFRVLLGFEQPETGSVFFDGMDSADLDMRSIRRRMGTVLQNGKLFAGDIYSNIVIGAPWLTVDEAWVAAEQSGFAEEIKRMPMGMFTMVSEGGGGLSGGQQQRLLITRALAAKPDILLFDEATSALDNLTQEKVVNTLEQLSCTRLVIAHRLSTIKNCSRIVYLDKGRVVEEGTFDQLMALNGRFAELAMRQMI